MSEDVTRFFTCSFLFFRPSHKFSVAIFRLIFFVSALLWDCSLCWDRWPGTWLLHLTRPCLYVVHQDEVEPLALGWVLIWVERQILRDSCSQSFMKVELYWKSGGGSHLLVLLISPTKVAFIQTFESKLKYNEKENANVRI